LSGGGFLPDGGVDSNSIGAGAAGAAGWPVNGREFRLEAGGEAAEFFVYSSRSSRLRGEMNSIYREGAKDAKKRRWGISLGDWLP